MAIYKELTTNNFQFRQFSVNKQRTFTQANTDVKVYDAYEVTSSAFFPWLNATASDGLYKRTFKRH